MKKVIFISLIVIFTSKLLFAQLSITDREELKGKEDSLQILSDSMLNGSEQDDRQQAGYAFIRMIAGCLKIPESFNYKFDSLKHISILYPPEREFRILTWYIPYDGGTQRYYGVIQMNSAKNIFYPLLDFSEFMQHENDTVTDYHRWFGAIYYKLIEHLSGTKKYYTLIGFSGNDYRSNKKVMEILSFDPNGQPVFGAPVFDFGKDAARDSIRRFIIEYKESATTSLNLDAGLNMVVFDHLVPQDPSTADLKYTYVPDGTYEGFTWKNGKWSYVENVFTSVQKMAPVPNPVYVKPDDEQLIPKNH